MQKIPSPLLLLSVLLGVVWLSVSGPLQAQTGFERPFLLTEEEAGKLRLPREPDFYKSGPSQETLQSPSSGPTIVFKRPALVDENAALPTLTITTPLDLSIAFEPNLDAVDMASLKVRAVKGWFHRSLTERLQPHVEGTTLIVQNLNIPVGTFRVEISIADRRGRRTVRAYYLYVQSG